MQYTEFQITQALELLKKAPDGSIANRQARELAAAFLNEVARDFDAFASLKPDSTVAVHLRTKATEYRAIAEAEHVPGSVSWSSAVTLRLYRNESHAWEVQAFDAITQKWVCLYSMIARDFAEAGLNGLRERLEAEGRAVTVLPPGAA